LHTVTAGCCDKSQASDYDPMAEINFDEKITQFFIVAVVEIKNSVKLCVIIPIVNPGPKIMPHFHKDRVDFQNTKLCSPLQYRDIELISPYY
jgi:hypothetical protein